MAFRGAKIPSSEHGECYTNLKLVDNIVKPQNSKVCPYCTTSNPGNVVACLKCSAILVKRPFLSGFQLQPCSCKDCDNNTVHIKARTCGVCGGLQKQSLAKFYKIRLIDLYHFLFVSEEGEMSAWRQMEMYFGLILGVYFSNRFRGTTNISDGNLANEFLIAGLLALLIMPNVYGNIKFTPKAPFILRLGFYFQSGVFSDVLLATIEQEL